jgi:hydrogenase maturation protein HypF
MKSVLCLADGRRALCSEHLGDLDHPAALRNFMSAVDQFQQLTDIQPARIACDLHPDYAATRYARRLGLPLTQVQHHHAHLASCLADNGLTAPAVGIVCDGTGYGTDGSIWGGELLVGDAAHFLRAGHLRTFRLPGGEVAAVETWRPAAALLADAIGHDWADRANIGLDRVDPGALQVTQTQLASDRWTGPITSSLGRLFDAAAFLTGLCDRNRCQAQAPMALQAAASRCRNHPDPLPVEVADTDEGVIIDPRPWFADLADRVARGEPTADLARAFHDAVIAAFAEGAERVARRHGLDRVVLSGGCLANRLLLAGLARALAARQLTVYTHRRVPPGDGGVALGQVAVAAAGNTNAEPTE